MIDRDLYAHVLRDVLELPDTRDGLALLREAAAQDTDSGAKALFLCGLSDSELRQVALVATYLVPLLDGTS